MRWIWIDRIVELEPERRLVAMKNVSLAEEHLHDHFGATPARPALPLMPATLVLEGVAQAAGILVGHAQAFREKVILAKVTSFELEMDPTPGVTLRYSATIRQMDRMGAATHAIIELLDPASPGSAREIGRAELMFSHLDQNMAGMEFPAHNFVFGETFKNLLRQNGIAVDVAG